MNLKTICLIACSILFQQESFCQFNALIQNIATTDSVNVNHPEEKIFVHYDRPFYSLNDTVWLKGYIVFANDHAAADSSKIVYIEINDATGQVVRRLSTYCAAGIFYASIRLNETDFRQGNYTMRAYTNRMRNYGEASFFESEFTVIDAVNAQWKLAIDTISMAGNRFVLEARLKLFMDDLSAGKKMSVQLRSKNKVLFKQQFVPGKSNIISIDTLLRTVTKEEWQLEIYDDDVSKISMPVFRDEQKMDIQFLPEGGNFVAGKLQRLGFKAINFLGKGITVKGRIVDSEEKSVVDFSSVHKGMGVVWLQPKLNEQYTAVLENGKRFLLPMPQQSGTLLQVMNNDDTDSIHIIIDASAGLDTTRYYFNASARGISCARGIIQIIGKPYKFAIAKNAFPSGVCRFILFDKNESPVNERAILISHPDTLHMQLLSQKAKYSTRDSVQIRLKVNNAANEPAVGSFSVAVIDTNLVQYPKNQENIICYLLLQSDIKGNIEEPFYYLNKPMPEAVDALMLTQGWVKYSQPLQETRYGYEKEFSVTGAVTNLFNRPLADANLLLFGKDGRKGFLLNTAATAEGKFSFTDFPVFTTDSVSMLVRAVNKKGHSFGVGVIIDTPVFNEYHLQKQLTGGTDWIYDTITLQQAKRQVAFRDSMITRKGYLPEVILRTRTKVKGSKNLNDNGGADQVIAGNTLEKTPKQNLLTVLEKQVPGFHKGVLSKSQLLAYKRNGDLIVFVIDGYNINQAYDPVSDMRSAFSDYEENYLKYILAEDVAGIEIMTTSANTHAYESYFNTPASILLTYTFIEITTYSGHGAFDKKLPGMYLYKPLAPVIAKTFYSPRYEVDAGDHTGSDYRSTVYWNPSVITNENGEAVFSFYTTDNTGGMLVIIQGTDMKGGLGVGYLTLPVKRSTEK